jgi:hypothetical protein
VHRIEFRSLLPGNLILRLGKRVAPRTDCEWKLFLRADINVKPGTQTGSAAPQNAFSICSAAHACCHMNMQVFPPISPGPACAPQNAVSIRPAAHEHAGFSLPCLSRMCNPERIFDSRCSPGIPNMGVFPFVSLPHVFLRAIPLHTDEQASICVTTNEARVLYYPGRSYKLILKKSFEDGEPHNLNLAPTFRNSLT